MLIDSRKILLLCLYLLIIGLEVPKSQGNWITNFIKCTTASAGIRQLVILFDENGKADPHGRSEMLWKAIDTLPSRKIGLKEATIENAKRLIKTPSFLNPQTSLFVMIHSQKESHTQTRLSKVHDFIVELSQNRKRPKYLMIFLEAQENQTYKSLLRVLWSKQFLDATVLEIIQPKAEPQDFIHDHYPKMAMAFYYNPFTKSVIRREVSQNTQLFPDKLIDMHGYEMKIAFLNRPPLAFVNHNQSTQNVSGLMFLKMKALSKAMKFSIKISGNFTNYGKFSCSKNGSTGLSHSIKNNEINLSGMEFGRFAECDNALLEWCRGIGNENFFLVVPILQDERNRLTTTWNVLNAIVVLCMPLILWFISRILQFNKRNWRPEYMVEIVLGFSVPREPEHQAERFFFAAALFAYFLFSSVIYTALTSVNVSQENSTKFRDIDEVINSELQILVHPTAYAITHLTSFGSIRVLLDKAVKIQITDDECIDRLLNDKNVACIVKEVSAKWKFREKKDSCGQPVAKIMEEYVMKSVSNTALEPGSPFVNKIDNIIQRFYQTGSVQKWMEVYDSMKAKTLDTSLSCTPHKSELSFQMRYLIVLVGCGYTCSVIVFLFELLTPYLKKKWQYFRGSQ